MSTLLHAPASQFPIVVGLKFSDGGAFAVDQATRLALHIPSASVHLVHVLPKPVTGPALTELRDHLALYAREKVASLGGLAGRTTGIHLRHGEIADGILAVAAEVGADLIVLGANEHPLVTWFTAPTVAHVMASSPCPVLVAGPKPTVETHGAIAIEPPCEACVAERRATGGRVWWCARHSEHAAIAHSYSYTLDLPFETRDTELGPTGA